MDDLFKSLDIDKGEWLEDIERGDSRGGSRGGSQGAADPPLEAGANVFRFGAHTRIYGGAGRPATWTATCA